jgi:acetyl-CoA carboxylase biotin carboxyl carrier protein
MIDLDFVERLIRALDQSSLDSLELDQEGTRVRLSKGSAGGLARFPASTAGPSVAPVPAAQDMPASPSAGNSVGVSPSAQESEVESAQEHLIPVTSPMVGTFYRSPGPDAPPFVDVGGRVGTGTVLCIIEAMKLMNELESEVEGTIAKIVVENAQPVEYGQVLFLIDPS